MPASAISPELLDHRCRPGLQDRNFVIPDHWRSSRYLLAGRHASEPPMPCAAATASGDKLGLARARRGGSNQGNARMVHTREKLGPMRPAVRFAAAPTRPPRAYAHDGRVADPSPPSLPREGSSAAQTSVFPFMSPARDLIDLRTLIILREKWRGRECRRSCPSTDLQIKLRGWRLKPDVAGRANIYRTRSN